MAGSSLRRLMAEYKRKSVNILFICFPIVTKPLKAIQSFGFEIGSPDIKLPSFTATQFIFNSAVFTE